MAAFTFLALITLVALELSREWARNCGRDIKFDTSGFDSCCAPDSHVRCGLPECDLPIEIEEQIALSYSNHSSATGERTDLASKSPTLKSEICREDTILLLEQRSL